MARRKEHAVDPHRFGAAQERTHVLRVLEGVQRQHERRLAAFCGACQNILNRSPRPRSDNERDPLVTVELGNGRERSAFHFNDRDPKVRCMEHDAFQCLPSLGNHEQPKRGAPGDEGLLDGAPSSDELFIRAEKLLVPSSRRLRFEGPPRGAGQVLRAAVVGLPRGAVVGRTCAAVEGVSRAAVEGRTAAAVKGLPRGAVEGHVLGPVSTLGTPAPVEG